MLDNLQSDPVEGSQAEGQVTSDTGAANAATQASDEATQNWSQVEIEGRRFQSPQELKEYITKLDKRLRDKDSYITQRDEQVKGLGEQLAELRDRLDQMNVTKPKEEDEEAEFLSNPTAYIKKIREQAVGDARALLTEREKEIYGNLKAVETEKAQWDGFLESKPHLKVLGLDFLKTLARTIAPSVKHLPHSEALEYLADKANDYVLKIKSAPDRTPGTPRPGQTREMGIPKAMTSQEYQLDVIKSLNETRDKFNPSYTSYPNK